MRDFKADSFDGVLNPLDDCLSIECLFRTLLAPDNSCRVCSHIDSDRLNEIFVGRACKILENGFVNRVGASDTAHALDAEFRFFQRTQISLR